MPTIGALILGRQERARIAAALGMAARIQFCERIGQLYNVLEESTPSLLLTEIHDSEGSCVVGALGKIRERYPGVPIVAYAALAADEVRELLLIERWRFNNVVFRGLDDEGVALRAILMHAMEFTTASAITQAYQPFLPAEVYEFFVYCAANAWRPLSVGQVSDAISISRRTLVDRHRRGGLPPPRSVIGWHRILYAAWHFDRTGASLEGVAGDLHFPSASALSNLVKRYTRFTPSQLRDCGGFQSVLTMFRTLLPGAQVREHGRTMMGVSGFGNARTIP